jgi:hypothetical protein
VTSVPTRARIDESDFCLTEPENWSVRALNAVADERTDGVGGLVPAERKRGLEGSQCRQGCRSPARFRCDIGRHSLRSGLVTRARRRAVNPMKICDQTGHKTLEAARVHAECRIVGCRSRTAVKGLDWKINYRRVCQFGRDGTRP